MTPKPSQATVRDRREWTATRLVQVAAFVFAVTAIGGLSLAAIRLDGTPLPPTWLAIGHGLTAATGLGLLIYAASIARTSRLVQFAIGVFVVAALGGITMFIGFHLQGQALPIAFVIGHGLAAATGLVLLVVSVILAHDQR